MCAAPTVGLSVHYLQTADDDEYLWAGRLRDCAVSNGVRNGSVALQNGYVEVIFNG